MTNKTDGVSAMSAELGIASSGAPRVEACIDSVMRQYPTLGGRADQRYYEAVHQELAPLARELERELVKTREDRDMWAAKWSAERKKYAALRWPGLTGTVMALAAEDDA